MKILILSIVAIACTSCANLETRKASKSEAVREKIVEKQPEITQCYGKNIIDNNRAAEAKLLVSWDIDNAGKAINAEVLESSTENNDFSNCILKSLETVQFEKSTDKHSKVKMPFVFSTN